MIEYHRTYLLFLIYKNHELLRGLLDFLDGKTDSLETKELAEEYLNTYITQVYNTRNLKA